MMVAVRMILDAQPAGLVNKTIFVIVNANRAECFRRGRDFVRVDGPGR